VAKLYKLAEAAVKTIGNVKLLDMPEKVAFLSSRKIAPTAIMRCYEWASKVRDEARCIVGGFHSPLEKDVLKFLLRGTAPVVIVLARTLWKRVPEELRVPVDEGRLLIVSPVSTARADVASAEARNRWILSNCTSFVLGSLDPVGRLSRLVASFPPGQITRLDLDKG